MDKAIVEDKQYNDELSNYLYNHRALNYFVMSHTKQKCETDPFLINSIAETKSKQYIVFHEESLNVEKDGPTKEIIVSKKRSFEAASAYKGKKVAVLNFANSHVIGGGPFFASAQEESLCRTSTLFECLLKEEKTFYQYHKLLFDNHKITSWGNDDLIYSPGVVVFKTDESAPKMMKQEDWYKVDIITSAAPEMKYDGQMDDATYSTKGGLSRLTKVFEVAKKEGVEVLILGAWGCGAFSNPPTAVASIFKKLCSEYSFETIEFAIDDSRRSTGNYDIFKNIICNN